MDTLKIALLQALPHDWDQDANLEKGEALCRQAAELDADVALFPEMWNVGYRFPDDRPERSLEKWRALAVPEDGAYVSHFSGLARELDMAIAVTYLQEWPGAPRNAVSLIDRTGALQITYAKVHTCDFGVERNCTPGDSFPVCELATDAGNITVGAMICFDREHPESARVLMLQGAELVLVPNACTLEQHRLGQFKARAFENMFALAMTNYPAPHCNGHSIVVDPVIHTPEEPSRDTVVLEAGEEEGVFVAELDVALMREYRARAVWGDAYRRPDTYAAILSPEVREPFVREGARRDGRGTKIV